MTRTIALLALLAAAPAAAQARYLPQADTLFYESVNPYRMYFVGSRGDTLGTPVREAAVARQVWRAEGGGLRVEQRHDPLDVRPTVRSEVFALTPAGVVRTIDGDPDQEKGQFDLVLRLPADGDLRVGRVWHDTIDQSRPVPGGEYAYQAVRELRVERMVDSLGGRMAVVRSSGRLRYRLTEPMDSTGTRFWWMDVEGPVDETFLFDVRHGRMAAREWRMDLRGTGAIPGRRGRVDTLAAGLLSMDTMRLVSAERARLVGRGVPAGDTTVTTTRAGEVLLYGVRREGELLESGMRANDGATSTVRAVLRDGRAVRYELVETRVHEPPRRLTIELRGGALHASGGGRDTVLAVPRGEWTVMEGARDELLAPLVARLAAGAGGETGATVALLRPGTLSWDSVQVSVRPLGDALLANTETRFGGGGPVRMLLLVTREGDLLYARMSGRVRVERAPTAGSPRAERVRSLLRLLEEEAGG